MSQKKKKIRNELIALYIDTTGSTATRATKCNDKAAKYLAPDWYLGNLYGPLNGDIIL